MDGDLIGGRYRLREQLGSGAMSEVWLADDEELERPVALKLLASNADRQRFEREARAVAALSDPNVARLYDYGEEDGRPYMALEYLSGGTLAQRLAAGKPLADAEATAIARQIASGLAHAHAHGLVHRDLKPGNLLFDADRRAKIADFGIARIAGGDTLTEAGTVLGTAAYISPEQARGQEASPASDVYSFGVILYHLLTGRPPFTGTAALEVAAMHRDREPRPISSLREDAPAELAALAGAAMAKDPARRPRDGSALVAALGGAAPAAAETVVLPWRRPGGGASRRRLLPLVAGALILAGAGVAAAVLVGGGDSGTGPTTPETRPRPTSTRDVPTAAPPTAPAATTALTTAPVTAAPVTTIAPPPATTEPPPVTTEPLPTTTTLPTQP